MPRIASVNQDPGISPGRSKGAAVHLAAMREAFARLGCQVTNFDETDDSILAAALDQLQRQHPLDFVYERYSLGNATATKFANRHRLPLVLEVNSPLADEQRRYRGKVETDADRLNDKFIFSNAASIVAVSSAVADYAVGRGAQPRRVTVRPNGIDERRFNITARKNPTALESIQAGSLVLGFHGRERPWHGFGELAKSFEELLSAGLAVHLLIIGEGEFAALERLPASSFTRLGWRAHADMPGLIANFDLLPLTYHRDAPCYFSPLKLMEAMACGVVPIVPDLGDLAATVRHGKTGYTYPAGDMERLVAIIMHLHQNTAERNAMGLRAAGFAATRSWVNIARQILLELRVNASDTSGCEGGQ